jgi:hypothetical protein
MIFHLPICFYGLFICILVLASLPLCVYTSGCLLLAGCNHSFRCWTRDIRYIYIYIIHLLGIGSIRSRVLASPWDRSARIWNATVHSGNLLMQQRRGRCLSFQLPISCYCVAPPNTLRLPVAASLFWVIRCVGRVFRWIVGSSRANSAALFHETYLMAGKSLETWKSLVSTHDIHSRQPFWLMRALQAHGIFLLLSWWFSHT